MNAEHRTHYIPGLAQTSTNSTPVENTMKADLFKVHPVVNQFSTATIGVTAIT
jgi:hypothetical protein